MISILDCGMGNIGSIVNVLSYLGLQSQIISSPKEILEAKKIILPGVGNWDYGIGCLNHLGIREALDQSILVDKVPILGICLGMQMFFKTSEEGTSLGLSWIPGKIIKFNFSEKSLKEQNLRTPHMGWNVVTCIKNKSALSATEEDRYYFVHSYHVTEVPEEYSLMSCHYGYDFICAVRKENIWGVQFHPEKSHRFGLHLIRKFVESS